MFRFREPVVEDAKRLLDWRTTPEITRYLYTDVDYDLDRQRAWIATSSERHDMRHFVIEKSGGAMDGVPLGYLVFSGIDWTHRRCSTGHYFGEADFAKRFGGFMHCFIMD